jgi:hypothetical protein
VIAMTDRTKQGLAVVGAALAFGISADLLGRAIPARLDVALGLGALALVGGATVYRGLVPVPRALAPLGVPFALLALALIWRDSAPLFALNLGGIALLAALASPRVRAAGRRRSGAGDYVRGGLQVAGGAAAGAWPLLLAEIDWRSLPDGGPAQRVRGALVGLVAAAPVAALFGSLLMEADPVFGHLMTAALGSGLDPLLGHGASILFWGWVAAGTLRLLLLLRAADRRDEVSPPSGRFSLMEVGTVLLVVDLLFLAFVAVQFRYLFGGAELVRGLTGLGYAEYAREGFFQLVTVAALSLPLLLGADRALGRRDPATLRRFRWLAAIMLVLLNVMLASALWRMRLYTAEYGLTELRFYTTAFMGWLVLVFGWFGATVLRGRTERFGFGAVAAAFFVLGTLNLVNPDALIASTNLARAGRGRPMDTFYLRVLSADALPTIRGALPALPAADRCAVQGMLLDRWPPELERRPRWNIAFSRARSELERLAPDCRNGPGG